MSPANQRQQEEKKITYTLSSIFPSKEMMDYVMGIIAREQQNPSREQTVEQPTSEGPYYLSPLFPSKEMEEYVMGIIKELE